MDEQGDVVMEELTGLARLAAGGKTSRSMAEVFVYPGHPDAATRRIWCGAGTR